MLTIVGVVALLVLKAEGSVIAVLVRLGVVAALVIGVLPQIKELLSVLDTFSYIDNIPKEALKIMLKAFSVLAVSSVAGDICRDNGESSLAGVVEMSGKIISIAISLPVITSVVSVATSLFQSD